MTTKVATPGGPSSERLARPIWEVTVESRDLQFDEPVGRPSGVVDDATAQAEALEFLARSEHRPDPAIGAPIRGLLPGEPARMTLAEVQGALLHNRDLDRDSWTEMYVTVQEGFIRRGAGAADRTSDVAASVVNDQAADEVTGTHPSG